MTDTIYSGQTRRAKPKTNRIEMSVGVIWTVISTQNKSSSHWNLQSRPWSMNSCSLQFDISSANIGTQNARSLSCEAIGFETKEVFLEQTQRVTVLLSQGITMIIIIISAASHFSLWRQFKKTQNFGKTVLYLYQSIIRKLGFRADIG